MNIETIEQLITDFINHKRFLGFKYIGESRKMKYFCNYLKSLNIIDIKLDDDTLLPYISQNNSECTRSAFIRYTLIRQFLLYLKERSIDCFVPPIQREIKSLFVPYIFSHDQIKRLLQSLEDLRLTNNFFKSKSNYPILFRLLYTTGLRISEALNITLDCINLEKNTIKIVNSKYNISRIIVITESMKELLTNFIDDNHKNSSPNTYIFRNGINKQLCPTNINRVFRVMMMKSNIPYLGRSKGPRLHDLRHTFCCHSLKQMSEKGIDLYVSLPILSVYIGHKNLQATERYVRLTQEFFSDLLSKTNKFAENIFPTVWDDDSD
ncbi:MAG: tyrosine-type recombinase/integrase [Deltaproteobacteria bacterium]|jgi:integrase|nr:tyrosine-type recombinase/integrase [Deltaproteobacteria bacterium]